jgi:hypothetical protein
MQINWGKCSSYGGRAAACTATLAAIALAFLSTGCDRYGTQVASQPVAMGVPPKVTQKVDNAQAAYINSLRTIATDYDAAVCEEESQMAQSSQERQAMSEANLEVAQAWQTAKESVQTNRGGGPPGDEGVIIIEEAPPEKKRDRGGWTCQNASGQPSCVAATASATARKVFRDHMSGYNLNPVTMGDVFEAFAADAAWADQYLVAADTQGEAYEQIRQACKAGESPLAQFFRAAADFDHAQVRRDLLAVRDDFVGVQQNVCEALPMYYENVLKDLQSGLSMRIRNNRCSTPQWEAMWE